jgi:putative FmdB family regulatory protein
MVAAPWTPADGRDYHRRVPIYEFRCDSCGGTFDALVDVGTEALDCRTCGAPGAVRIYSAQAAPFGLVKSPGDARAQERRNAQLRERTKGEFKARRKRAREGRGR